MARVENDFSVSPLLASFGFRHAFFTRRGGVSESPFDTLSFSVAAGDREPAVAENRERAARALGVPTERLLYLSQVHGKRVHVAATNDTPLDMLGREGDALASATAGIACGVRSADCVPVLVGEVGSGAVVAVHSGWKGAELDVCRAAVEALGGLVGTSPRFVAAIGPHIEACCFEVDVDVASRLARASAAGERVVRRGLGRAEEPRPHVDLRAIVRAALEARGLAPRDIDDVPGCTVCEPERFFSYRRDGARSGRLLSAIVARGPMAET